MNLESIPILYKDDNYVIINKPAGLVVHPDGKTNEPTLVDWIIKNFPETKDVGEPLVIKNAKIKIENEGTENPESVILRPGIVHRIDRETTGVLVIVRTAGAHAHLKQQFQARTVKKTYHAFVFGEMKEEEGVIDRPIGKSRKDFRMWSAQRGAKGTMREAVTEYKVVQRNKDFSFVEAYPKTGRTHQIRVHFKAINHPVVCDKLYAPKRGCALGFGRVALHAYSIAFTDLSGKTVAVQAPYPDDFKRALEKFKESCQRENGMID